MIPYSAACSRGLDSPFTAFATTRSAAPNASISEAPPRQMRIPLVASGSTATEDGGVRAMRAAMARATQRSASSGARGTHTCRLERAGGVSMRAQRIVRAASSLRHISARTASMIPSAVPSSIHRASNAWPKAGNASAEARSLARIRSRQSPPEGGRSHPATQPGRDRFRRRADIEGPLRRQRGQGRHPDANRDWPGPRLPKLAGPPDARARRGSGCAAGDRNPGRT